MSYTFTTFEAVGRKKSRKNVWKVVAYMSLFTAVAVIVGFIAVCHVLIEQDRQEVRDKLAARGITESKPERPSDYAPHSALNASVRQSPFGIAVTNGSAFDFEDVTVKINYGLWGGYSATRSRISAGGAVVIPYSDFTNSSDERFNYATTKPNRVMVGARVGGSYESEEFRASD